MAAGIADPVWTVGKFLLFQVPPWRQERAVAWGEVRRRGGNDALSASARCEMRRLCLSRTQFWA
jgi:hypothetical protein